MARRDLQTLRTNDSVIGRLLQEVSWAQRSALDRVLDAARDSTAASGQGGRRWTREELHNRADLR